MTMKIVCDSSADLLTMDQVDFAYAPLKIITDQREYVDDESLDVMAMVEDLKNYKGKSSSACPGVGDWLSAFGDADCVFCVTISSNLSGSYNAARLAKEEYEQANPGRKVYVLDSLSAGPEMTLAAEKLWELIQEGLDFDAICKKIRAYWRGTGLVFALESLTNLANNGRVKPAVAKIASILGIRLIGKASVEGTLEPTSKARGEKRALEALVSAMLDNGYAGGKVIIHHCDNPNGAAVLQSMLVKAYPGADVAVGRLGALCSYYAERGGILIGFEKG